MATVVDTHITVYLRSVTCCKSDCGIVFGLNSEHQEELRRSHKQFHCPNGHPQAYLHKTREEQLAGELERMKNSRDYWENTSNENYRSTVALRGVITRTRNRIANGVCPCCKRSFQNLRQHIGTKHPNYKNALKEHPNAGR